MEKLKGSVVKKLQSEKKKPRKHLTQNTYLKTKASYLYGYVLSGLLVMWVVQINCYLSCVTESKILIIVGIK